MASSRKSARGKMKNSGDLGGFTIIEVVLVLAIAGLIFLMVFIALPALQRSQRDTQRRDDLARVSEALTQYQTNNKGKLPKGSATGFEAVSETNEDGMKLSVICPNTNYAETHPEACFIRQYLNSSAVAEDSPNEFVDPDGWAYGLQIHEDANTQATLNYADYKIHVYKKAECDGESVVSNENARSYAVTYKLEGRGTYCQDSK